MANLPILIPSSEKTADGYSLMPFRPLAEEEFWPAEEKNGYLEIDGGERNWISAPKVRIEQIFVVDGHDVRTEARDPKTGKWRQRQTPMAERTDQIQGKKSRAGAGLPLREVRPSEYSRLKLLEHLGSLKTDLLTSLVSLQTALEKRSAVDIETAAFRVISAGLAEAAPARKNEFTELLQRLRGHNRLSDATREELNRQFGEKERRLSERSSIYEWIKLLHGRNLKIRLHPRNLQIFATSYTGQILSAGRVIFWVTATKSPQMRSGIFFPNLEAAIAAAVVLDRKLRRCLNPKCERIFSASRDDAVCCNLRCSNAFRQFRHSSKRAQVKASHRSGSAGLRRYPSVEFAL